MKEITLVPTSHIAEQSLKSVQKAIEEKKPPCIAVELDINRYYAMKTEQQVSGIEMLRSFGPVNYIIYFLMKKIQTSLGDKVGVLPGSEMVRAVDIASENRIKVAFIDRDIGITFLRLSKIPFSEKLNMIWFLIKGSLGLLFSKIYKGKYTFDLTKNPSEDLVNEAMAVMKKELPGIYKVLVTERDTYMANRIKSLLKEFDNIVIVTGAGHYKGIKKKLSSETSLSS
jgi:pheromone shutdown-related protein TraB